MILPSVDYQMPSALEAEVGPHVGDPRAHCLLGAGLADALATTVTDYHRVVLFSSETLFALEARFLGQSLLGDCGYLGYIDGAGILSVNLHPNGLREH